MAGQTSNFDWTYLESASEDTKDKYKTRKNKNTNKNCLEKRMY